MKHLNSYIAEALVKNHINITNCPYVDLGLKDGALWATCNIGAEHPWEYGDYFMCGDTTPATNINCCWENYKYGESRTQLTKYNNSKKFGVVDKKKTLDNNDDMAMVNSNNMFKLPTEENIDNLINDTECQPTTINDIKGYTLISKSNGKSIFLPLSGHKQGAKVYGIGNYAFISSANLSNTNNDPANVISLGMMDNSIYIANTQRHDGLVIRPILNK